MGDGVSRVLGSLAVRVAWLVVVPLVFPSACSSTRSEQTMGEVTSRDRICGVCYAHNWQDGGKGGYGSDVSRRSLDELKQLGIRRLSITPFGWMDGGTSTEVRWSTKWQTAESFARLRRVISRAKERGMRVTLKPHIWVRGAWRGVIAPALKGGGWPAWFRSYRGFILAYAKLAAETRVETFVVGVELKSATRSHDPAWREVIEMVRKAYGGTVIYAANWDEAEQVSFWDALDGIGVQMFAPIAKRTAPEKEEVVAAARSWLRRYESLAKRFGRPLIVTEVGFVNTPGGLQRPYVWPDSITQRPRTPAGDREQQLGYEAIVEVFGASPHVRQISWWKWFSNPAAGEEGPTGYMPRAKPAAQVLRRACASKAGG